MKRIVLSFFAIGVTSILTNAQPPQFAVVRPNGTTYICPTWDSAHSKAMSGDAVYMPGGLFSNQQQFVINKRLYVYGAGSHPDSSIETGRTQADFIIDTGAVGGSLEGISGYFNFPYSGKKISGYSIRRCNISVLDFGYGTSAPSDSLPSNVIVSESVIEILRCLSASQNIFTKNLFKSGDANWIVGIRNSSFKNNIFFNSSFSSPTVNANNCLFENNIIFNNDAIYSSTRCTNTFRNNLYLQSGAIGTGCPANTVVEIGTINVGNVADVFVNYNQTGAGFPYIDNYRLKPTCLGVNAGTDGTDVGIYGTSSPTPNGWIPSNPHISFKQVADQTNSNGQLQIQFKVRTNN